MAGKKPYICCCDVTPPGGNCILCQGDAPDPLPVFISAFRNNPAFPPCSGCALLPSGNFFLPAAEQVCRWGLTVIGDPAVCPELGPFTSVELTISVALDDTSPTLARWQPQCALNGIQAAGPPVFLGQWIWNSPVVDEELFPLDCDATYNFSGPATPAGASCTIDDFTINP